MSSNSKLRPNQKSKMLTSNESRKNLKRMKTKRGGSDLAAPALKPPPTDVRPPPAPPPPPIGMGPSSRPPAPPPIGMAPSSRPPPPPLGMAPSSNSELKTIHIARLGSNEGSIYQDRIEIEIDMDILKSAFAPPTRSGSRRAPIVQTPDQAKTPDQPQKVQLLDFKTSQVIQIQLRKIGSLEPFIDFLKSGDIINNNDKQKYLEILEAPSFILKSDVKEPIISYDKDKNSLDKPEQFIYDIEDIPNLSERINVLKQYFTIDKLVQETTEIITTISTTLNSLRYSRELKIIIDYFLTIANRLNEGTSKGQAEALNFSSLPQLRTFKTGQGVTLIAFIAELIFKRYKADDDFKIELLKGLETQITDKNNQLFEDILTKINSIQKFIRQVSAFIESEDRITSEDPKEIEFKTKLKTNLTSKEQSVASKLKELNESLENLKIKKDDTLGYFCAINSLELSVFFYSILNDIIQPFSREYTVLDLQAKKEATQQTAPKIKTASSSSAAKNLQTTDAGMLKFKIKAFASSIKEDYRPIFSEVVNKLIKSEEQLIKLKGLSLFSEDEEVIDDVEQRLGIKNEGVMFANNDDAKVKITELIQRTIVELLSNLQIKMKSSLGKNYENLFTKIVLSLDLEEQEILNTNSDDLFNKILENVNIRFIHEDYDEECENYIDYQKDKAELIKPENLEKNLREFLIKFIASKNQEKGGKKSSHKHLTPRYSRTLKNNSQMKKQPKTKSYRSGLSSNRNKKSHRSSRI